MQMAQREPTRMVSTFILRIDVTRQLKVSSLLQSDVNLNLIYNSFDLDEFKAIGEVHEVSEYCDEEMFCGMPLYNHRWNKAREYSLWIPLNEAPQIPSAYPNLTLYEVEELEEETQRRFNFTLTGPDHMTIFINVKNNAKILDWSFNNTLIRENEAPPHFIYFSYGLDNSPLEFSIDVEVCREYLKM